MLITCTNCQSKIRVPETAIGKRVKCPKCATVLQVPTAALEETPPATRISESPSPAPSSQPAAPDDDDGTEVTATPPSKSGKKPPPLKAASKRGSDFDDGDVDDEEDTRKSSRKRRRDLDDDDLDVRRGDRRDQPHGVNSYAMTSMILGIVSVVSVFGSCCCGLFGVIAILCAVLAIVFGFMGKVPGSETYAWTGIICGGVAIVLALAAIAFVIVVIGMDGMMQFNNMNQPPRRF